MTANLDAIDLSRAICTFRKRGKYWSYRIRVKGFNDEWTEYSESGFHSKPEARKAAMEKEVELKNNEHHGGKMLFKVFGEMWLENYVYDKLKPNTYKTYRNAIPRSCRPCFWRYVLTGNLSNGLAIKKFVGKCGQGKICLWTVKMKNALELQPQRFPLSTSSYIGRVPTV